MLLLFWIAGPSVTQPRITLSLAPAARITLFTAQATPSIRLKVVAVANPFGQAAPSVTLSLGPVLGTQPGQVAPRITLALAPAGRALALASGAPHIVLALGPATASQKHVTSSAPHVRLALVVYAIGGLTPAGSTVVEMEYNAEESTVTIDQRISVAHTEASTLTLSVRN